MTYAEQIGVLSEEAAEIAQLAAALAEADNLVDAAQVLEGLTLLNPLDASAQSMLGCILLRQGKLAEARARLETARALDPTDVHTLQALAKCPGEEK